MSIINPVSNPSAAATAASSAQAQASTDAKAATGIASTGTFLQLLVAQIKNQDPLQPTDGTQFLTQLAQFSQLEQLIGIRSGLDNLQLVPVDPASPDVQVPSTTKL